MHINHAPAQLANCMYIKERGLTCSGAHVVKPGAPLTIDYTTAVPQDQLCKSTHAGTHLLPWDPDEATRCRAHWEVSELDLELDALDPAEVVQQFMH